MFTFSRKSAAHFAVGSTRAESPSRFHQRFPQHFRNVDFLDQYETIAKKYEIPKGLIELELTESIFFDANSLPNVDKQIKRMHELGFHCSLD